MQNHATSNIHPFTSPFDSAESGGGRPAASSPDAAEPGTRGNPLAGGATRGRKSTYHPRIIEMLCQAIRQLGLSDSAAAEQMGLSRTTLSRWKQVHPEVGLQLQQARQEIRVLHLQKIMESASAENGKGWRASAWILERLFPEDYARKISDRFDALNLIEFRKDKERRQISDEDRKEQEEAQKAAAQARAAAAATAAKSKVYSESVSHNSRNSVEAEVAADPAREGANQSNEPERPRPVDPYRVAATLETPRATMAGGPAVGAAVAPLGNLAQGRADSLDEATRLGEACVYSEAVSHNSRYSNDRFAESTDHEEAFL